MELSLDQATAISDLTEFLVVPYVSRPYFSLQGLAGTGKTYVLAELVRRFPKITLTAFTGKAASVLRTRIGVPVSTLHSAIYDFRGLVDDEFDPHKRNQIFTPKGDLLPGRVIAVDESSMIGRRIARDLLDTGARVIAAGDPGQLPPVRDAQFFTEADATLREVHRQAWDSPIVRQAHAVRECGTYEADGGAFRVIGFADPGELLGHDILLCWRNRTRLQLNKRKRKLLGINGPLRAGEPLMCLKNDHHLGLYNGAVYEVIEHCEVLILKDADRIIKVSNTTVESLDPNFERDRYDDGYLPFALAYASTVHKAQGSEYESVLLFDECESDDWRALTYTGITRAKARCTVVQYR